MRPKRELQLLSEPFGRRTSEVITVSFWSRTAYVETPRDPTASSSLFGLFVQVTELALRFPFFPA